MQHNCSLAIKNSSDGAPAAPPFFVTVLLHSVSWAEAIKHHHGQITSNMTHLRKEKIKLPSHTEKSLDFRQKKCQNNSSLERFLPPIFYIEHDQKMHGV